MRRRIVDFREDIDEDAAWVAVLDCHHGRHVRHAPPLRAQGWVLDRAQREARIGVEVDCLKCDRLELPEGLEVYKRTPVFTEESLPAGLRREHTTRAGVWARIEILDGVVDYVVSAPVSASFRLDPSRPGIVAPLLPHHLETSGPFRLRVSFLAPAPPARPPPDPGSA